LSAGAAFVSVGAMKPLRWLGLTAFLAGLAVHAAETPLPDGLYAEFGTPRGSFVAQLFYERTPMTCASFVGLAEGTLAPRNGRPFYTGLRWYRVVPGFVIQSGDPTTPSGGIQERAARGEPEDPAGHPYSFPDEFVPGLRHDAVGMLSMANDGPDTNSTEFFLTLAPTNRLNYLHSVFGKVIRGLDVLPQVQPDDPCTIRIRRIGSAAAAFRADPAAFQARVAAAKKYPGRPLPGPAAHCDDPDRLLPVDPPRAKNFNFKLANFERTTGVRVVARLFAHAPAEAAANPRQLGAWVRELAAQLGVAKAGALAVYLADRDEWRLWFGDDTVTKFVGHAAGMDELMAAKEAFVAAARAAGDADYAAQKKAAPADRPPAPGQHLKLQTDAILDGLILKLEP